MHGPEWHVYVCKDICRMHMLKSQLMTTVYLGSIDYD